MRRLLEMGPALFFCLLASYGIIAVLLDVFPASPALWHLFLIFSPSLRELYNTLEAWLMVPSVFLIAGILYAAYLGILSLDRAKRYYRFAYFHCAFLLSLYTVMKEAGVSRTEASFGSLSAQGLSLDTFGYYFGMTFFELNPFGAFLLILTGAACISWHFGAIDRLTRISRIG